MAKILNILIGAIGISYICGQVLYYAIVGCLNDAKVSIAIRNADNYLILFNWVMMMGFLIVLFGFVALIANFIKVQDRNFGLRLIFNIVCIFMPFLHIENYLTVIFEGIFLVLFGLYLFTLRRPNKKLD